MSRSRIILALIAAAVLGVIVASALKPDAEPSPRAQATPTPQATVPPTQTPGATTTPPPIVTAEPTNEPDKPNPEPTVPPSPELDDVPEELRGTDPQDYDPAVRREIERITPGPLFQALPLEEGSVTLDLGTTTSGKPAIDVFYTGSKAAAERTVKRLFSEYDDTSRDYEINYITP